MYEGPMDMDNRVRINCGAGQRRAKGENWDNCNRITKKDIKREKIQFFSFNFFKNACSYKAKYLTFHCLVYNICRYNIYKTAIA